MKTVVQQLMLSLLAAAALSGPAAADVRSAFAFRLSDASGELPFSWTTLNWDAAAAELYVIDSGSGLVNVFNEAGMSVYTFGGDEELGSVAAVAPLANGDLLVLSNRSSRWALVRCNFRGEPRSEIALQGLPASFAGFHPGTLRVQGDTIYLAELGALKAVAANLDGAVSSTWDLKLLLGLNTKKNAGNALRGFNVDRAGNLLVTVPGMFLAAVVSPDGKVQPFGQRGSSPGKFNVVAGIASDESGRLYVSDTLRAVVMVFGSDFKFLGEFGYRGFDDDALIAPNEIAVGSGRVFVSQSTGGVKAFDVLLD